MEHTEVCISWDRYLYFVYTFYQQSVICCEEMLPYLPAAKEKGQLQRNETTWNSLLFGDTSNIE
jgi:hypothetical protein